MSDQLPLFDAPAPPAGTGRAPRPQDAIAPAQPTDSLVALGRALPEAVRLGTSSWSFPGWAGIVYARAASESVLSRHGLAAYAAHPVLRTVGIDRTFYAPVDAGTFAAYARQVPEHFRFLVKGPAAVTDASLRGERGRIAGENPRFLDARLAEATFVEPCLEGLGASAGPLVFQFSPLGRSWTRDPERFAAALHAFLDALPKGPLYAVELRDPELLCEIVAKAIAAAGARQCIGIHSRMPGAAEQAARMAAAPPGPLIARWNLHAGFAYEEAKAEYAPFDRLVDEDPATRDELAALAAQAVSRGDAVYVVANNKAEGSAPLTAGKLAQAIIDRLKDANA